MSEYRMLAVVARRAALAMALWAASLPAQAEMPRAELSAGMYRIDAEVANTFDSRATGLMRRSFMAGHAGMIFVYPEEATHCMWMRNTLIPLSVAFLEADGTIINIEEMAPQTETNHCARRPARFALEMNAGWFATKGIAAGQRIRGIDALPPAR